MNDLLIDLILAGLIVVSGLHALMRGFVIEIVLFMELALSIYVAFLAAPYMSTWLAGFIYFDSLSLHLARVILFITSLLLMSMLLFPIKRMLSRYSGLTNRIIGFLYGLLRGHVIFVALIVLYYSISIKEAPEPLFSSSYIYMLSEPIATRIYTHLGSPDIWSFLPDFLR